MSKEPIEINLKFEDNGLAGFDRGVIEFNNQCRNKLKGITKETDILIHFPNDIQGISSSFVQGFFKHLIDNFGYDYIINKVTLRCETATLALKIKQLIF